MGGKEQGRIKDVRMQSVQSCRERTEQGIIHKGRGSHESNRKTKKQQDVLYLWDG